MSKKRKVEDSELEQVNGGGGVHDPVVDKRLEAIGSDGEYKTAESDLHDLSNDMIQQDDPDETLPG